MRTIRFTAMVWTMFLAIPMTALGISLAYYLTDHLLEIAQASTQWNTAGTLGGLGWLAEFSARWPELVGLVVGQLVLMLILVIVRRTERVESAKDLTR